MAINKRQTDQSERRAGRYGTAPNQHADNVLRLSDNGAIKIMIGRVVFLPGALLFVARESMQRIEVGDQFTLAVREIFPL